MRNHANLWEFGRVGAEFIIHGHSSCSWSTLIDSPVGLVSTTLCPERTRRFGGDTPCYFSQLTGCRVEAIGTPGKGKGESKSESQGDDDDDDDADADSDSDLEKWQLPTQSGRGTPGRRPPLTEGVRNDLQSFAGFLDNYLWIVRLALFFPHLISENAFSIRGGYFLYFTYNWALRRTR